VKSINELTIGMVNYNCNPLLLVLSIESVLQKTYHFSKFFILDNGSTNGNVDILNHYANQYDKIEIIYNKQKGIGASIGKGEGLNILLSLFNTEYGAFVENDGFLIKQGWDSYFIEHLLNKNLIIIGCGHPKYINKTVTESLTTFSIFKTVELQKLGINFLPKGEGPSFLPGYDTGCELIEKVSPELADILIFLSSRKDMAKLFAKCNGVAEFWYHDQPIFAHFGRGTGHSNQLNSNFFSKFKHLLKYFYFQCLPFTSNKTNAWNYFDTQRKLKEWTTICKQYLDDVNFLNNLQFIEKR